MTKASVGALAMANQELVVAHVGATATEADLLEVNAPPGGIDGDPEGDHVDAVDGGANDNGDPVAVEAAADPAEIAVSEVSSILSEDGESSSEQSLPSTTDDDTDSIDSDHEGNAPRRLVTVVVPSDSDARVVTNAIVGDENSAEADANAVPEVGTVENRLDESVPWEDYVAPAPDGGDDDDDGGDDDGDDDDGDDFAGLGPVDRARLRFQRSLEVKLRGFQSSGVAEPLLIQQLTHG